MTKTRNGIADQARRSARRLAAEGKIARNVMTAPISAFQLEPGDFPINRRRDPGATYKRATTRMFVFSGGGGR